MEGGGGEVEGGRGRWREGGGKVEGRWREGGGKVGGRWREVEGLSQFLLQKNLHDFTS